MLRMSPRHSAWWVMPTTPSSASRQPKRSATLSPRLARLLIWMQKLQPEQEGKDREELGHDEHAIDPEGHAAEDVLEVRHQLLRQRAGRVPHDHVGIEDAEQREAAQHIHGGDAFFGRGGWRAVAMAVRKASRVEARARTLTP